MDIVDLLYQKLIDTLKKTNYTDYTYDFARIEDAYNYARSSHSEQLRKDGSPYMTHPLSTAIIVAEMGLDDESIIAALLHDCIEDTIISYADVVKRYGAEIADIVEGVTKLTKVVYTSKEEAQMENLRKMLMAMAKDIRVILIKIADRLHNMRTMEYQTERKQREKSLETMEIYAPLAHRLGMQKVKWELEDLSLIYLDPIGYREIEVELDKKQSLCKEFFSNTQKNITAHLKDAGIDCAVSGRVKHMYSIYRKMYGQNKQFSEVMDLYAFRVIVNSISDCYNVLGHIHDMYKPIPGHFKDYIGTPKPNMYQSLHTTVIGSDGIPFEVQIRTWEMHHTAEYGIAAHWKYKEGIAGKQAGEEKFAWVRQLLESQQDSDAVDFFHTLKSDMFTDEVFVFTPKGDVINLPVNATPIDFAYNIHSAVGNHMTGAKVNGRIVPFNYILQNGDIVEVMTSKSAKGPSRDWLTIVASSEARTKIRQWIKKEKRDENIAHGRVAFESELKHAGITLSQLAPDDVQAAMLKKVAFQSLDDMYAAIGYGGISAQKTVNKIKDELRRLEKTNTAKTEETPSWVNSAPKPQKAVHGIVVEGVDNVLVKFAKCCTPVPGDRIMGFITRGFGVSVHRADCENYLNSVNDAENVNRWIPVSWAETNEIYQTSLSIVAESRGGLIMDISTLLNSMKINISSMTAKEIDGGLASFHIVIDVKDKDSLTVAISRLSSVKGVRHIQRTGA